MKRIKHVSFIVTLMLASLTLCISIEAAEKTIYKSGDWSAVCVNFARDVHDG